MLILQYLFWFKEGEEAMKISDLCEENMGEPSTEEVVLQDLQRASEKVCVCGDLDLDLAWFEIFFF